MRVLEGVRVLEACRTTAGRFAGLLLAELGADVVRLQLQPGVWDATPPAVTLDRSKRAIALEDDHAPLPAMLRLADVVVCDLDDDHRERLGLAADQVTAVTATTTYADITPY